ncbi:hypothetical protein FI667_g9903, partial [Globisporangium splendens]
MISATNLFLNLLETSCAMLMMERRMWQRAAKQQLQRAARASAPLSQRGAPHALLLSSLRAAASCDRQAMAFATRAAKKPAVSFEIAEAFDGLDDEDDDDSDNESTGDGRDSVEGDGTKKLSKEFLLAMEKKKTWMQRLAQERKFDHIVKTIYDCYAPLYAHQSKLVGVTSSLAKYFDEKRVETKYQPRLFNDTLTKITEQEALALLVIAKQGPLAVAIFEHRRKLAKKLGAPIIVPGDNVMDDTAVDLASHFRSFYSWGMSAYSLANNHDKIFALYDEALAAQVYPTVNMNASYLKSLISKRRFDDVFTFYNDVQKQNRPTNVFFYRQMLFFANIRKNAGLLLQLLEDMKIKGFKLRAEDYLNAIKTFDDRYYLKLMKSSKGDNEQEKLATPTDTYATCVQRINDQEDHPEVYQELDDAAHSVVTLFEEMVDEEQITPTNEQFFPRAIAAAVYVGEFEKAIHFLELHGKHCTTPLHYAGVRMAVNAYLLLDQPEKAWTLVREAFPKLGQREFTHVANIIEYLCIKNNTSALVALLQDAKQLQILPHFSNQTVKILLPALIRNVDTLSDEQLWALVSEYEPVFHVRSKPYAFSQFLNECVFRKRLVAAKLTLEHRDGKRVGAVKGRLGVRLMKAFSEVDDIEFLPTIFDAVNLKTAKQEDVLEICCAAIRAYAQLGRAQECRSVYKTHLKPFVKVSELPSDVQAALSQ